MVEHTICSTCQADISGVAGQHLDETMHAGYYSGWRKEQTGTKTYTVNHPEQGHYESIVTGYNVAVEQFNRLGLTCFEPEGAFYVFPSIRSTGMTSDEFCERLIYDKRVAVVPGSAFGACGEGHVRISYAYSLKHLAEALDRMAAFLQELKG